MKKIILLLGFISLSLVSFSQVEKINNTPIYIDDTLIVVGVRANTSDKELMEIRTKLLKYSTIRFIEFDVIREPSSKQDVEGDIQFLSLEIDCRDGYIGRISHSFEKGDNSIQGFYRNYSKNTYSRAFFIGQLADKFIVKEIKKIDTVIEDKIDIKLDQKDVDYQKVEDKNENKSFWSKINKLFFWKKN